MKPCETCGGLSAIQTVGEGKLKPCPDCGEEGVSPAEAKAFAEIQELVQKSKTLPCPDCQKPDPIARLTGAKCDVCLGKDPICVWCNDGTGRAYPWSVRKCPCTTHDGNKIVDGQIQKPSCWDDEGNNYPSCRDPNGGCLPLPDAELAMQVMGRMHLNGWNLNQSAEVLTVVDEFSRLRMEWYQVPLPILSGEAPLPGNPDVDAVIHAMCEAACAALMEVQ